MFVKFFGNYYFLPQMFPVRSNKPKESVAGVKTVIIFGAGISGLTAAVNLVKAGFTVQVHEKRKSIGGNPQWHPSVHQQVFRLKKTSEYIGIDLHHCFSPVKKHSFYFYGRKSVQTSPPDSYVCLRGQEGGSIESYLYEQAAEMGVTFFFNSPFPGKTVSPADYGTMNTIAATGLEKKPYVDLNIKHLDIYGYRTSRCWGESGIAVSCFGPYTSDGFAYAAACGDVLFSLLFAQQNISKSRIEAFSRHMREYEKIELSGWRYSTGSVPVEKNLVKHEVVLAGTLSGMIDPFYLNGISGALISGRIAALYFIDREKAFTEFRRFTRTFYMKRLLKLASERLPVKRFSFPAVAALNSRIKWTGVI